MGYQIDVAFPLNVVGSMTEIRSLFERKAEKNNCEMFYLNYEYDMEGRQNVRNSAVLTLIFPEQDDIVNFIRFAREFKEAKIESLIILNKTPKLIYASSYYQQTMERSFVKDYKKNRKYLTEAERFVVNQIR